MLRLPQPLWHLAGSQVAAAFEQLVPTDHPAHQVQRGFAVGVAAVVEREALEAIGAITQALALAKATHEAGKPEHERKAGLAAVPRARARADGAVRGRAA